MTKNLDLDPNEIVVRVLVRLERELLDRPKMDSDDFLRRKQYRGSIKAESGISVMRRRLITDQAIFQRVASTRKRLVLGLASCRVTALKLAGFKFSINVAHPEHVSLRCPACDMSDPFTGSACKSVGVDDLECCPFFDRADPLNLLEKFSEYEAPILRTFE